MQKRGIILYKKSGYLSHDRNDKNGKFYENGIHAVRNFVLGFFSESLRYRYGTEIPSGTRQDHSDGISGQAGRSAVQCFETEIFRERNLICLKQKKSELP